MDTHSFADSRRYRFLLRFWVMCATALAFSAHAQEFATPEAVTKAFYAWYIGRDATGVYPLFDEGIRVYVAGHTVDGLRDAYRRNDLPGDADYFLTVQDYDGHDWAAHIKTGQAILLGDVALVPMTFGSKQKIQVLVFLRQQSQRWKIVKVEDMRDYP